MDGASKHRRPTTLTMTLRDTANDRFREQVETTLGKRVGQRQRGRPPKQVDAPR